MSLVDVRKNRAQELPHAFGVEKLTVGYSGRAYITQAKNGHRIDAHGPFLNLVSGRPTQEFGHNGDRCPLIEQVRDNEFWFGSKSVFRDLPPQAIDREYGRFVIADRTQDVFYAMYPERIQCHALYGNMSEIGQARTIYPTEYETAQQRDPGGSGIAITDDGTTHLFVAASGIGNVYYQSLKAFDVPEGTRRSQSYSRVHRSDPSATSTHPPRTWTSRNGKSEIVAKLISQSGNKVVLERKDTGKRLTVALAQLSEADNKYVQGLSRISSTNDTAAASVAHGKSMEPDNGDATPSKASKLTVDEFPSVDKVPREMAELAEMIRTDDIDEILRIDNRLREMEKGLTELLPYIAWARDNDGYKSIAGLLVLIRKFPEDAKPLIPDLKRKLTFQVSSKFPNRQALIIRTLALIGDASALPKALSSPHDEIRTAVPSTFADLLDRYGYLREGDINVLLRLAADTSPKFSMTRGRTLQFLGKVRPLPKDAVTLIKSAVDWSDPDNYIVMIPFINTLACAELEDPDATKFLDQIAKDLKVQGTVESARRRAKEWHDNLPPLPTVERTSAEE